MILSLAESARECVDPRRAHTARDGIHREGDAMPSQAKDTHRPQGGPMLLGMGPLYDPGAVLNFE